MHELIASGGRQVVIEDSEWRTMKAFSRFRDQQHAEASFATWVTQMRPLTSLKSIRTILDLDQRAALGQYENKVARN